MEIDIERIVIWLVIYGLVAVYLDITGVTDPDIINANAATLFILTLIDLRLRRM